MLFDGGARFILLFVDLEFSLEDFLLFHVTLLGGFVALIVEGFLGFVEFVAAGGLIAGEALDGVVIASAFDSLGRMGATVVIHAGRYAAKMEGNFVVFLTGMRINRIWLLHKWLPVAMARPRMLKELFARPELGMLHAQSFVSGRTVLTIQYWRSFEQLHAYAHSKDWEHLPAWAEFNRKVGGNGSVGFLEALVKL